MLDGKDFWDDLSQGDTEPQAQTGGEDTDITLEPECRAEDKQATTEPQRELSTDIESVFADIREETDADLQAPDSEPRLQADHAPTDELDEKQLMREMLLTLRELTEAVKGLRAHMESRPHDAAHYPSEKTPGVSADADGGSEAKPDARVEQKKPAKKNRALSVISSVLFYTVIVAMVLGAFLMRSTSKGEPFMIAGYSAANVLTSSMADVYPQGSLIITKQVDAKELQIGDDITFMVSEDSSITHRIIGITENYQGTGARAFQTQGTKNPNPDKDMVAAANVVGKVIFHSKELGDFANFVKENWPILLFILIVIIALITFLKWNAKKSDEEDEERGDEPKEKKTKANKKKRNKNSDRRNESDGDE